MERLVKHIAKLRLAALAVYDCVQACRGLKVEEGVWRV